METMVAVLAIDQGKCMVGIALHNCLTTLHSIHNNRFPQFLPSHPANR